MFFATWNDFFEMGGYGFYIWLSYGISFFAVLFLIIQSVQARRAVLREVKRELAREQRQQSTKTKETL
ncbi:heme exporter protein CcmD [Caviibacterium pharyngocola]|uniref:Heme exporter protein D n=1 Tax=Caviibacterium pharyngocola TaxID=28159 RepID=A0A2M8RVH3_9PAST|nr:heme exporter protein CcmD [Caviibacterium pharyngocola]PJG82887.1 heme exporter protein CcmD [Caviibacterium pharyngocola]